MVMQKIYILFAAISNIRTFDLIVIDLHCSYVLTAGIHILHVCEEVHSFLLVCLMFILTKSDMFLDGYQYPSKHLINRCVFTLNFWPKKQTNKQTKTFTCCIWIYCHKYSLWLWPWAGFIE